MIRFAFLMEYAVIIAGTLFLIFQVIIPFLRGTPFFPLLRHRHADALNKLAEATEKREIHDIKKAAAGLSVGKSTAKPKGAK